ncbi:hypothetical protein BHYA_0440g00010 [Botrytis hyacinthi]|uniref:Uncharacterized protein n=1 Tax=Botrytis hyacinthi TaxID=278943 RepID=A0A4Z1G6S1_9HELO|nr:hypothetical protein BHYA_0440g00010 [Botrytis hyacinthi]
MATPRTLAQQVELLTKPPPIARVPANISVNSNTVAMWQGANCAGTRSDMCLDDYTPFQRHIITNAQFDNAACAMYNLLIGVVFTLMGGGNDSVQVGNLINGGHCIDLVGTGRTETCDFANIGMNDTASNFFWRRVDLNMGAIELFADPNFLGNRATLWLSEWEAGQVHSLQGWGIDNLASSLRWRSLSDRQYASFYNAWAGNGDAFNNVKGWGSIKEIANLNDVRMNDVISSFKWERTVSKKEIIAPFNISASNADSQTNLTSETTGLNKSDNDLVVEVGLENSTSQTVTVETQDQHVVGVGASFSQTTTAGVEDIASASTTWEVQLNYSYTNTSTKSNSYTETINLTVKETVTAPPRSYYRAELLVSLGRLRAAEYVTTAERWYVDPVIGGVQDPSNQYWYKRVETVRMNISGSLACRNIANMDATPWTPYPASTTTAPIAA